MLLDEKIPVLLSTEQIPDPYKKGFFTERLIWETEIEETRFTHFETTSDWGDALISEADTLRQSMECDAHLSKIANEIARIGGYLKDGEPPATGSTHAIIEHILDPLEAIEALLAEGHGRLLAPDLLCAVEFGPIYYLEFDWKKAPPPEAHSLQP